MSHVRIVDDSETITELLRNLLTYKGHGVSTTTQDFGYLLTEHAWHNVDVALIDLQLTRGGLSGFDVLAYLAEHHPTIRRVVLSGNGDDPQVAALAARLAHRVLSKPTGVEEIEEAFRD